MALTDKLTAIANAIRGKTGDTAALTLAQMPDAIAGIVTEAAPDAIPSYVKSEARRVINAVAGAQNANTVTFLALSDCHQLTGNENITDGNHHAGLGAKIIAQALDLDFVCLLGDITNGSATTTIADGTAEIQAVNAWVREAFANIPNFRTVGNHDALLYSYSQNGDYLRPSQLYDLIGKYNEGATVDSANPTRGYCYRDFTDKQLRVICLNTSDGEETGTVSTEWKERISGAQMAWFAQALDLSGKATPANWKILVLSHHPLDWGVIHPATKIIDAYVGGKSVSFTHNGTTISKDYSGINSAKFVGNFHGHVHCFRTDNLYLVTDGTGVAIENAIRIATPNSCFSRNNEYGENDSTEYYGIEFGETTTYSKTAGTGQDTAFVVYVVDTAAETIQAFCYGAGYDRIIGYGEVAPTVYSVTYNLTNVTSSNTTSEILEGNAFTATLAANTGYEMSTVTVTMGGVDITSTSYSGGVVTISEVTGDIIITAVATEIELPYTNLIPTATTTDGTTIYNDIGYKDGMYASTGSNSQLHWGEDASYWATGIIKWDTSKPLYIKGWTWNTNSHTRMYIATGSAGGAVSSEFGYIRGDNTTYSTNLTVTTLDADAKYVKVEAKSTRLISAGTVWFVLSMPGTGAGVIITQDEEIV